MSEPKVYSIETRRQPDGSGGVDVTVTKYISMDDYEALRAQVAGLRRALVMCREGIRTIQSTDEIHWHINRKLIAAADLAAMEALAEAAG